MKLKIKLQDGAKLPKRATAGSSGFDLHAIVPEGMNVTNKLFIRPGEHALIPTGVSLEIPEGYEAQIRPRSGLAKDGIVAVLGTIDADYRGELKVNLHNNSFKQYAVSDGDRIAQLVIVPIPAVELELADELNGTNRGANGFGSSGV